MHFFVFYFFSGTVILSPLLGTSHNAGVMLHVRPLVGPQEGKGEATNSDFVHLCLGIPHNAKAMEHFRPILGPLRQPMPILCPFVWGPPRT